MKNLTLYILLTLLSASLFSQTYPDKIGIGLGGIGGFGMEFTDAGKTMRSFDQTSVDANGYPEHNFTVIVYDMRPCCPWVGSVDDPYKFVPALMSGTYKLSFKGKAAVTSTGDPVLLQNQVYDEVSNTTTLDLVVQRDKWLVNLSFSNTRRTAASALNTGVTDIKLLRPGYHNRPNDVYRQEYINAVSHFPAIRFMDFTGTNNSNPTFPEKTEWNSRRLPSQPLFKDVAPWEYVIELANITGKDVWINIPVAASNDYITQLAKLFKDSLTNPSCKIYIEYSNEVWNGGFKQYEYNRKAAIDEVKTEKNSGVQTLLNDEAGECDKNDTSLWCGRSYVKRLKEIGDIFVETFSPGNRSSFETRVRPVFAWQIGGWVPYYSCILKWFEYAYGPAKNCFYGLAGAAYVNAEGASYNATVEGILSKMKDNSNAGIGSKRDNPTAWTTGSGKKGLKEIADIYKIRMLQYETGPDNGGGDPSNIANRIAANRNAGMKSVLMRDLKDNWFANPDIAGDLSMYFVLCSSFTRYGSWGATEEVENMHTPKLQAIYEITGIIEDMSGPSSPGNIQKSMVGNDAVITWEAATDNVAVTHYRISDNSGALATVLANEPLSVTLKNYNPANLNNITVIAVDAFNNVSGFKLGNDNNKGVKEHSLVFPNPSKSGNLTVYLAKNAIGGNLTLLNAQGETRIRLNGNGATIAHMNLDSVAPGLYLLKIEKDAWFEIIKVIIQ